MGKSKRRVIYLEFKHRFGVGADITTIASLSDSEIFDGLFLLSLGVGRCIRSLKYTLGTIGNCQVFPISESYHPIIENMTMLDRSNIRAGLSIWVLNVEYLSP